MDAWSSPWGDDSATPYVSTSKQTQVIEDASSGPTAPAQFLSLSTLDASDPWANDTATPAQDSEPLPDSAVAATIKGDSAFDTVGITLASSSYAISAWGDASTSPVREALDLPTSTPSDDSLPTAADAETRTTPDRQRTLTSEDPWATDVTSGWGGGQQGTSLSLSRSEPEAYLSGWGTSQTPYTPPRDLEQRLSSTHIGSPTLHSDFHAGNHAGVDDSSKGQDDASTDLHVWATEASTRQEKARRLSREEIDELKVDARNLISSVNTDKDTQASFALPSSSEAGWTDLFGSQGTQRDKLHHLQTPPSTLTSSSGALRTNVLQSSPATLNQLRSSLVKTDNRGVKLTSAHNNSSWSRGSRPATKTNWLPDQMLSQADDVQIGTSNAAANSSTTSGPGWTQTSSNDTRSTSGPGFLASLFKGRGASSANASVATDSASNPTNSRMNEARSSSSFEASPAASANSQFESYQDAAGDRYTDDPTGPDLLSLDATTSAAPTAPSKDTQPSASAQGAGLLSRWRGSGIFKASAKKQNPSWASSNLRGDDLDWLDQQGSTDSKAGLYHYDDDEEGADDALSIFEGSAPRPPSSDAKTAVAPVSQALDPFDNIFAPAAPAVQSKPNAGNNATATSSARSSLSATGRSSDGGMMTINTNLGRTNSFRKKAASPLQPPPQTQAQSKRMSFAPPPRANAASPSIAQVQAAAGPDPFANFLTDAPSQPTLNANAVRMPSSAPTTVKAPSANGKGGLTADDLMFFDSL